MCLNSKVSVYIPTCNRSKLLARAVMSVLNQDHKNLEIIIVDDNSVDDTQRVVAELMNNDARIKYYKNSTNKGACFSRNYAISKSEGDFVTGLDDDDCFMSSRLSDFLNLWSVKPDEVIALYSNKKVVSQSKEYIIKNKRKTSLSDLYKSNCVGNQIFTSRDVLLSVGGFDEKLGSLQDLELWIRILHENLGSYFLNSNVSTYLLDKSHPHERISSKNVDFHLKSCDYITSKYSLSKTDSNRLLCQIYLYDVRYIPFYRLFSGVISSRSLYLFFRVVRRFLKARVD